MNFNQFTDCMRVSFDYSALRNGGTHSESLNPKISVNVENIADAPESESERTDEPVTGDWTDLIKNRIKANLDLLNAQISTLTQLLKQLVQDNSALNSPTAGPCTHPTQPEP